MPEPRGENLPEFDQAVEFPAPDVEAWRAEAIAALKGASFEQRLVKTLPEGISLLPLYTREATAGLPGTDTCPGQAPYLRGTRVLGHRLDPWEIAQEIPFRGPDQFNEALRQELANGQTAVVLRLDAAGCRGIDPDAATAGDIGRGGTSIATPDDLDRALSAVDLESVPIFLHAGSASLPATALLLALMRRRGQDATRLRGSLGTDPLADLLAGDAPVDLDLSYDALASLTAWATDQAPGVKTLAARGAHWHDAGANAVEELAWTFASAVRTLRAMEKRGITPAVAASHLLLEFAVGPSFLVELAKFRAARLIWARLLEACGCPEAAETLFLHARTAAANLSAVDPHTNIMRTTTESLSALLGGCDGLTVLPYDTPQGLASERARRLARNTQLILREESHLDRVMDAAGGAWAVESLTAQLAEKAWDLFRVTESEGGLLCLLETGRLQARVAEASGARRQAVATRREILVGVNQYANPAEATPDSPAIDDGTFAADRVLSTVRFRDERPSSAATTEARRQLATMISTIRSGGAAEEPPWDRHGRAVVEAAAVAAARGATLGEIAATWRAETTADAGDRSRPLARSAHLVRVPPLESRRLSEPFESLRQEVRSIHAAEPAGERAGAEIFLANVGPRAAYRPRLEFIHAFFALAGFRVDGDVDFEDPPAAAAAAARSGAPVVCIVSTDEQYPAIVPELTATIRQERPTTRIVLAGLPTQPDRAEAWRKAGIDEFIHLRSDAPDVLLALAGQIRGEA